MSKKRKTTAIYRYLLSVDDEEGLMDETKKRIISFTRYDKSGNVVEELKYNEEGEVEEKYVNRYDDKGHLVEEFIYLTDDEIAEHKSYERDDSGKISQAFIHYQDGSKDTILYSYNSEGLLIEKKTFDTDGEYESKECAVYEQGKLVKKENFDLDEKVLEENFIYNENGEMATAQKWSNQEEDIKYIHSFDSSGSLLKTLKYNSLDQLIAKTIFTYNNQGLLAEINEEFPHGQNLTTILYDDKGNSIEQTEKNEKGELNHRIERVYNDNNDIVYSKVRIYYYGRGIDQHYILQYEYEF